MSKRYATVKYNLAITPVNPTDVEHEVDATQESLVFYFNEGGKTGTLTTPKVGANITEDGFVHVYFTDKDVPDVASLTPSEVELDDVLNNPNWSVYSVNKFEKDYDENTGLYGDTLYLVKVDVSRLAGNFQIVAFYRNM